MPAFLDLLYALSGGLLIGMAFFVFAKNPTAPLNQRFALTAAALLFWLATLYLLDRSTDLKLLTFLGRLNFVGILWTVLFGYLFVCELTDRPTRHTCLLVAESLTLTLLTLLTPYIDRAEYIRGSVHGTEVGGLFALFAAHVLVYPAAAFVLLYAARRNASRRLRTQLSVIGVGIAVTVGLVMLTGLVLPYAFHIFAFEEIGALSTIFFLGSIAYAITVEHLFDIRIVIKKTVVFAIIVALVERAYSGLIELLVRAIPGAERTPALNHAITIATVIFIAASFSPIKRWLERWTDRLLYPKRGKQGDSPA